MRVRLALLVPLLCLGPASPAADTSPRDTVAALNALRLDAEHVYTITPADRIELRRGDLVLTFEEGKLAFYQPFEGRITGLVFSGLGHTLALPRDPAEKQQMARFLGSPVLDQRFVSIYARFTDATAQDLEEQLARAAVSNTPDTAFAALWLSQMQRLNPTHSLRILTERYSTAPRHFFHAGVDGILTGPFDVLIDDMRYENFTIGQPRSVNKVVYYDVWTSYALPDFKPPVSRFDAPHYQVNTTIRPDNSLEGDAAVDFRSVTGGERMLFVQLARALKVDTISSTTGETLAFFQNEGLTEQELRTRGDDTLCIFLARAPQAGEAFTLRFHYRGNVIENYGNSVLYVGNRESWYPHFGDPSAFAHYDLTFRWPKQLRLVATGEKSDETEQGDFRVAHWKSGLPVPEAGFNLGEYAIAAITSNNHTVEVYANKQLEQAILARLSPALPDGIVRPLGPLAERPASALSGFPPTPLSPSPTDALKTLAREVDSSISFFEKYSGPFPFQHLAVSQIPGAFGQGWPGLLYLSTYSYLPPETQERVGLNSTVQEAFTDIIPVHEVAHQWWGNVVGWSSYRDQWIDEGLAVYLALLFADSQKNANHTLATWLNRYRKRLVSKPSDSDIAPADVGPVIMGMRLDSSKSPGAYDVVAYSKGAWIFHMLREMLREPGSKDPDARFVNLLRTLAAKYPQKPLSTDELQKEVESVMTPRMALEGGHSMEWFFEQYVKGTGIPRYKVEFTSRRTEKGYQIHGKLHQYGVPPSFIAPVPIYLAGSGTHGSHLGTVMASGEETSFTFHTQAEPHKLVIDPKMTLLCLTE
jgi:Peptidase family M1 domain